LSQLEPNDGPGDTGDENEKVKQKVEKVHHRVLARANVEYDHS